MCSRHVSVGKPMATCTFSLSTSFNVWLNSLSCCSVQSLQNNALQSSHDLSDALNCPFFSQDEQRILFRPDTSSTSAMFVLSVVCSLWWNVLAMCLVRRRRVRSMDKNLQTILHIWLNTSSIHIIYSFRKNKRIVHTRSRLDTQVSSFMFVPVVESNGYTHELKPTELFIS